MTYEQIRYAPYLRRFFSIVKNLRKGKFHSLFRRYHDKKYRADIKHLWKITEEYELEVTAKYMPLGMINHSHDINYPQWVEKLVGDIRTMGVDSLEPIKVIYDRFNQRWIVVDGNHRLAAMRRVFRTWPQKMVEVKVLHPKGSCMAGVVRSTGPYIDPKLLRDVRDVTL